MSTAKLEEICCPCGEIFEAELWNSIDVKRNPELKEMLIAGEINVVCCPACHEIFYAEHFILYHDPDDELLAFVYPLSFANQYSYWKQKMNEDFSKAMDAFPEEEKINYEPVLLFGLNSLVQIINRDTEEKDEVAILRHMAEELGLSTINLKPSLTRMKNMPRLLPRIKHKGKTERKDILAGLKKLLGHNKNLTLYRDLCDEIEKNKDWGLEDKLIVKK
jgi:hypothetical protein